MRLEKLRPLQVQEYFEHNDTVIIPTGSIECHGTHNVLGVDTLAVEKLAELIDQKSDTLIATVIPYGICDSLSGYPGTISIGYEIFYKLVQRVSNELYKLGARRFVFLNGHGGNIAALSQVSYELSQKGALGAILNWWIMSGELNPDWKGGHGGAQETSAMLAIDPALVRMDLIEDMGLANDIEGFETKGFYNILHENVNIHIPRDVASYTKNGWIGPDHPKHSTQEWGQKMLQSNANYICGFIKKFKSK